MHKINTVKLKFIYDDDSGIYGATHENTHYIFGDVKFDPFWDGQGIFHDVFEHWFEGTHKYFRNDAFMNVGGEIAASGTMCYFMYTLGVPNRMSKNTWNPINDLIQNTTLYMMQEAIEEGYCKYGVELVSHVPYQPPMEHSGGVSWVDTIVEETWDSIKKTKPKGEIGEVYRKSITKQKIKDLYYWGYRKTESMIDDTTENSNLMIDFIEFWNNFCHVHSAEDMYNSFRGMTFHIYKDKGRVKWTCRLHRNYGDTRDDFVIRSSQNLEWVPDYEELFFY